MGIYSTLDGRVVMDQAAFATFCETPSMDWCAAAGNQLPPNCSGQITVDADASKIMLEASAQLMRNQRLLPDLQKAAQAGQVDGAFMIACTDGGTSLEAVVIDNSETRVGHSGCINSPVDIGPATTFRLELGGGRHIDGVQRVTGIGTQHRVTRHTPLEHCECGFRGGDQVCRNDGKLITGDDGMPVVDIATLMPDRATGKLEQALLTSSGVVNADGRRAVGRIAWKATGPALRNTFRAWLGTFPEATGERHVTWVADLFGNLIRDVVLDTPLVQRPVCAHTGSKERGLCPAFLICDPDRPDTIRVPAHVDNASLADGAKLAAGGADPAEAVAIIAAITDPDRR